jgi:hypothetical protein
MQVAAHVYESSDIQKRVRAYGYSSVDDALDAVRPMVEKRPYDYGIELRDLNPRWKWKKTGHSTGRFLIAIVRRSKVVTFLNADNPSPKALNVHKLEYAP